jgi:hypothetical protein
LQWAIQSEAETPDVAEGEHPAVLGCTGRARRPADR